MARPLFDIAALVRRAVNASSTGRRFQDVCAKAAKWFRRGGEMFQDDVAGTKFFAGGYEKRRLRIDDVTRLKYPWPNVGG
jgi:hypothetical protein